MAKLSVSGGKNAVVEDEDVSEEEEEVEEEVEVEEEEEEEEDEEEEEEEVDEEVAQEEEEGEEIKGELKREELVEIEPNEEQCEHESDEEEDPSEEDPEEEEELDEEREHCEEDEEEPSEESDEEDPSEEDPTEVDSEDGEDHQLNATASNPGEKKDIVSDKVCTKRQSRWDTNAGAVEEADNGSGAGTKKRKSRWASDDAPVPDSLKTVVRDNICILDPEILLLNAQLQAIAQKLLSREICDDQLENGRSPSPPPVYNELGIRVNTREARFRTKLNNQRKEILAELMQRTHGVKLHKPLKFSKKVYVPVREHPGYNFIGLILGPRGLTQKRMEQQSGAKILLRGKGSTKEGKGASFNPSCYEDLHVFIEADTQDSVNAAVAMVEKILVPVEQEKNELKLAQLRELAELHGSMRDPASNTIVPCAVCGNSSHLTVACPLTSSTLETSFNLGGGLFSPTMSAPTVAGPTRPWTGSNQEIDEAKLFVGYLPPSVDENKLIELFLPFGKICEAKVLRDKVTGLSRGYGFLKYATAASATEAISRMHGYRIEGKMLAVRVAGRIPTPPAVNYNAGVVVPPNFTHPGVPLNFTHLPPYPGPPAIAQFWPGPPGSAPVPYSNGVPSYPGPLGGCPQSSFGPLPHTPSAASFSLIPATITPPAELSQFPGAIISVPYSNGVPSYPGPLGGHPLSSFGSSSQTPFSDSYSLKPGTITPSNELSHFPGFLNSFDSQDFLR